MTSDTGIFLNLEIILLHKIKFIKVYRSKMSLLIIKNSGMNFVCISEKGSQLIEKMESEEE